jgi:hypothetical protein
MSRKEKRNIIVKRIYFRPISFAIILSILILVPSPFGAATYFLIWAHTTKSKTKTLTNCLCTKVNLFKSTKLSFFGDDFKWVRNIILIFRITAEDFITVNHEMGHIQYQRSYRNQSFLYRDGANPGFHEGIADILSLAVGKKPKYNVFVLDVT